MTTVAQSSTDDVIFLPARLMKLLNLQAGAEIKTIVEGQTLRLTPLESFLALRGVLQDDQEFDAAMNGEFS